MGRALPGGSRRRRWASHRAFLHDRLGPLGGESPTRSLCRLWTWFFISFFFLSLFFGVFGLVGLGLMRERVVRRHLSYNKGRR